MMNFGPLTAEISSGVWSTPANVNGFRLLASLVHRRRLMEVKPNLHDVWPFTGMVHFRGLLPLWHFTRCKIYFAPKSCVLLYWQRYCTTLE